MTKKAHTFDIWHKIGTGKFTTTFSQNATLDEEVFCIFGVRIFKKTMEVNYFT